MEASVVPPHPPHPASCRGTISVLPPFILEAVNSWEMAVTEIKMLIPTWKEAGSGGRGGEARILPSALRG